MTIAKLFMLKKIVIITGGPGFGKTSLIRELTNRKWLTGEESAREIITEQQRIDGDILPWRNMKAFQQEVLKRRIAFFESVPDGALAFSDRGIPDQLAFALYRGFRPSVLLKSKVEEYCYFPSVFICQPWLDIYVKDDIRQETYTEACKIHRFICDTYSELGYNLIGLPMWGVSGRADFILDYLKCNRPL